MSDHHRRIGRLGGLATAETSEAIREYQASPEGQEAARRRGQARAESRNGGRWGESGMLGRLRVDSACEKRVAATLMVARPNERVRRYNAYEDGVLLYVVDGKERQWFPDLTVGSDCYEVKFVPGAPTHITAEQVVAATPATANHIVEKTRAHPHVRLINGASDDMKEMYARLRKDGDIPPFVPDREGAPDL